MSVTWGDIRKTIEDAGYSFPDEPQTKMTREEFEAKYPRVKFYGGRAYHIIGWDLGVMWGRMPFEGMEEGALAYRHQLGIEVRSGLWRYLRGVIRIVKH